MNKVTKLTHIEIQELIWEFGIRALEYHSNKRTMEDLKQDCSTAADLIEDSMFKEINNQGWVEE